ncbi:MAG: hydroxymethylpyrimidine/phosphomethylpyrimidine kinase [Bacteroidetes bacterium]|nr:hydroxymethylpyrimidine/phosphomethylpyrimidine kinase [Bacteroidota bacterium]
MKKNFLTIAASDNSGGAGIQQDLKIAFELGYHGLSAITGITVQNFQKVKSVEPISSDLLLAQIKENFTSFKISVVKIGALCSNENICIVGSLLKKYNPPGVVLDTVFAPTKGKFFTEPDAIELYQKKLFPYVDIITPNKIEIELLLHKKFNSIEEAAQASLALSEKYNIAIYIKGGHFDDSKIVEALIMNGEIFYFNKKRLIFQYSHGTGCSFSSALSCFLGNGIPLKTSCSKASAYVSNLYKKI